VAQQRFHELRRRSTVAIMRTWTCSLRRRRWVVAILLLPGDQQAKVVSGPRSS
jgi:hypothetical protein